MYPTDLINVLVPIVEEASEAIMDIYQDPQNFAVTTKLDNSPVTRADLASNRIICKGLENIALRFPVISEENDHLPYSVRQHFDYCWLVDPLDGTKEFIKRNGEFVINIALIKQQVPVLGLMYAPATGVYYYAAKGQGAYKVTQGNTQKMEALSFSLHEPGLKVIYSRSFRNPETLDFIQKNFSTPQLMHKGSALKIVAVANGEAQVYPRMAPTMEWDTAAGQVILEEAGGKLVDARSGMALCYNKKHLQNPHFIAYAKTIGDPHHLQ